MSGEHSNWFCSAKWGRRLDALLAKIRHPYCNCQVEPWNQRSKERIREMRREERRARRSGT